MNIIEALNKEFPDKHISETTKVTLYVDGEATEFNLKHGFFTHVEDLPENTQQILLEEAREKVRRLA